MIDYIKINKEYNLAKQARQKLIEDDNYKVCFLCNNVLPLSAFGIAEKKYTIPSMKGRRINCNECVNKRDNDRKRAISEKENSRVEEERNNARKDISEDVEGCQDRICVPESIL